MLIKDLEVFMLYITFKNDDNVIRYVDRVFDVTYEVEWFTDPLVQDMVSDVDSTDWVSGEVFQSPVLGAIPPSELSGGVKALILMLKTNRPVWATACGDNCVKWILEIAKIKDITIQLEHYMQFPKEFEAICIDTNEKIHTLQEFRGCAYNAFH